MLTKGVFHGLGSEDQNFAGQSLAGSGRQKPAKRGLGESKALQTGAQQWEEFATTLPKRPSGQKGSSENEPTNPKSFSTVLPKKFFGQEGS